MNRADEAGTDLLCIICYYAIIIGLAVGFNGRFCLLHILAFDETEDCTLRKLQNKVDMQRASLSLPQQQLTVIFDQFLVVEPLLVVTKLVLWSVEAEQKTGGEVDLDGRGALPMVRTKEVPTYRALSCGWPVRAAVYSFARCAPTCTISLHHIVSFTDAIAVCT